MRELLLAAICALSVGGCSAAKSAMGLLAPKPTQVTVVNHVPPPVVVTVAAPAPTPTGAAPAIAAEARVPRRSAWKAIAIGAAAGAGIGTLVGVASDRSVPAAAAVGAGVGAVSGLVAHELAD